MKLTLDTRRIVIFLGFAFGIAWLAGLGVYLTGGIAQPGSLALMIVPYMWAPAIANLLTRLITQEGWDHLGLQLNFKRGWRYWVAAWVLPGVLTIVGTAAYFVILPQYYDANLSMVREATAKLGIGLWTAIALQIVGAILLSPFFNSLATFGEEFGWRGYLLPKLLPLGTRKAVLVLGVIWGVWHWPLTVQGHNYGFGYAGAPWTGMLAMVWFTLTVGVLLAWVTLRSGSVWPAVIGHAALNGIASLGAVFMQGDPNQVIGPISPGILGGVGFALFAALLLLLPDALKRDERNAFPPQVGEAPDASTESPTEAISGE